MTVLIIFNKIIIPDKCILISTNANLLKVGLKKRQFCNTEIGTCLKNFLILKLLQPPVPRPTGLQQQQKIFQE